jgi:PAS domain-containing protein
MFFPDPARGLSGFCRVLRPNGRVAVSVTTSPERSYNGMISIAVARHVPSLAVEAARRFSLGNEERLRSLFEGSGFRDVDITTEAHRFTLPSFEAYFGPFERGGGSSGQVLVGLPEEVRRAVREEIWRDLRDTGGPIDIEVEIRIASGRR